MLEELLQKEYSESEILETLHQLQDEYVIEFVIDDREDYSTETDSMMWYVKLLGPKERKALQSLRPVEKALFRILQQTQGKDIGEVSVEEAEERLRKQGFSETEAKYLSVEDWINHVYGDIRGENTWLYCLVPERERTREYKKWKEAWDRESLQHELEMQAFRDRIDAEDERRIRARERRRERARLKKK